MLIEVFVAQSIELEMLFLLATYFFFTSLLDTLRSEDFEPVYKDGILEASKIMIF